MVTTRTLQAALVFRRWGRTTTTAWVWSVMWSCCCFCWSWYLLTIAEAYMAVLPASHRMGSTMDSLQVFGMKKPRSSTSTTAARTTTTTTASARFMAAPWQQKPSPAVSPRNNKEQPNSNNGEQSTDGFEHSSTASQTMALLISGDKKNSAMAMIDATHVDGGRNDFSSSSPPTLSVTPVSKLRRLKDYMWIRETLEDLTAAEFACSVEAHNDDVVAIVPTMDEPTLRISTGGAGNSSTTAAPRRKRKRAVDYEKLLAQLNRRISDLGCDDCGSSGDWSSGMAANRGDLTNATSSCMLQLDVGMASTVYTHEQRTDLLDRLLTTRQALLDVTAIYGMTLSEKITEKITTTLASSLPELRVAIPREADDGADSSGGSISNAGPRLYVRDDGTVDWDGALQDQAALRKFGRAVWARINGREPELVTDDGNAGNIDNVASSSTAAMAAAAVASSHLAHPPKEVTAKIEETPEIRQARLALESLTAELAQREAAHTALLNSALTAGQAVANVKLAVLEPEQRQRIRESADDMELVQEQVLLQALVYDLERLYAYFVGELGNPSLTGYIPLQDRLNVAEFGLLESQIDSLEKQRSAGDRVDADVLAVVTDQLTDFKRRLGIDSTVTTGLSWDAEAMRRWVVDLVEKTKRGLAFYVKGVRLFWNDIFFCLRLINRAAQGYTLKPREVRTLRRTLKDIITFIPVVIILLIPLSPVGHVLVFGAIQRFFPNFFPSCFTEQRQNLLQLYETAEYSKYTIQESWRDRLTRISEAVLYFFANASRSVYFWILGLVHQAGRRQVQREKIQPQDSKNKTKAK